MSEIADVEKNSKNEVSSINLPKETVTGFEKKLFSNGTLEFDFDEYILEVKRDLGQSRDWFKNTDFDEEKTAELLAHELNNAKYELIWRKRFSGLIPKHWYIWYNVGNDFEEAGKANIQLSQDLIDAGISHPHHLVANEVGKNQKLNVKQAAWLFARPGFPNWNKEEILESQKNKGMSEEEIEEAIKIAEEVKNNMKRRIPSQKKSPKELH